MRETVMFKPELPGFALDIGPIFIGLGDAGGRSAGYGSIKPFRIAYLTSMVRS